MERCRSNTISPKGLMMVPRHATQRIRRRFDAVVDLYGSASGFSDQPQTLRLHRLDERLQFLGGARQALVVDARRVRKDVRGP